MFWFNPWKWEKQTKNDIEKEINKVSWNYRVVKENDYYTIKEVYYDKDGNVDGWTEMDVSPGGETFEEFLDSFELYRKCVYKPVLDLDTRDGKTKSGTIQTKE